VLSCTYLKKVIKRFLELPDRPMLAEDVNTMAPIVGTTQGNSISDLLSAKNVDNQTTTKPAITPDVVGLGHKPPAGTASKFKSNWLRWPVARKDRPFRVFVVEPQQYNPAEHSRIFNAAITSLVDPERSLLDPHQRNPFAVRRERFDLVTFPEAFLPKDDLLTALTWLPNDESFGCVHVGLRPSAEAGQHLFSTYEIGELVKSLNEISEPVANDLVNFSEWLKSQSDEDMFNIGCVFTIDVNKEIRVCLHPKLVRSKFEIAALHEHHMKEADLLTLITLLPADKALLSVTIQPLICSDALLADTDTRRGTPLEGVNDYPECFGDTPPEHIDIVSVATCTPQPQTEPITPDGERSRQWHQQFRESFRRAASEPALVRHFTATFVLSNFTNIPGSAIGGLSGAFVPIPLRISNPPEFVVSSTYGRLKTSTETDNYWSQPTAGDSLSATISSLGFITSLDSSPTYTSGVASMLGFTINRLLRDTSRWPTSSNGLVDFQLKIAAYDSNGKLVFKKEGSNA